MASALAVLASDNDIVDHNQGRVKVSQNPAAQLAKALSLKRPIPPLALDTPHPGDDTLRFVCLSDTHCLTDKMHHALPAGDVLVHAGDFTNLGTRDEVHAFGEFLRAQEARFRHMIVVAGNHDLSFDAKNSFSQNSFLKTRAVTLYLDGFSIKNFLRPSWSASATSSDDPRGILASASSKCIYLEDNFVELYGLKIYGSPWQPPLGNMSWAFNAERGEELLTKWNMIPDDVDVLVTHGPALGFGDLRWNGENCGCCELWTTVHERVKPMYHVAGHVHKDHGIWTDGVTTYVNATICGSRYEPSNPPIIFDVKLPPGQTKA